MITSEVNLEHAYTLASNLMWRNASKELPKFSFSDDRMVLIKTKRGFYNVCDWNEEEFADPRTHFCWEPKEVLCWLYLSDLDVLRVKE